MKKVLIIVGSILLALFAAAGIYAWNNDLLPSWDKDDGKED